MDEMENRLRADLTEPGSTLDARDEEVRTMLFTVVTSLVDDAGSVEMLHVGGGEGAAFQVRAATNDLGKLIGKSGRTARAIRTLLSACATRNGRRYTLDIVLQQAGAAPAQKSCRPAEPLRG
jgi:predicted RNA-binding protein YlqC (UPF0109 family)